VTETLKMLCLDIEGGYGGSSRSLYESLLHMDRACVTPEVWCRRDGPARARYEALGISCRIETGMPRMNSLPRFSRNLYGYTKCLLDFMRWRNAGQLVQAIEDRFDLVHFNHEGLLPLASWLRRRHGKVQTMHVRTMIPANIFGRWQCRRMVRDSDALAFITENERQNFDQLSNARATGEVIYNIATPSYPAPAAHEDIPCDGRLKAAVLSSFSWGRGIDRIVGIAEALAARGRRDILFFIAGDMILSGKMPGQLGQFSRSGSSLADYAKARGVADMIKFLGHIHDPETVLAGCDLLIKPTREANPWGRDILEASMAAKPVISIGHYDRFVESGETGFLLQEYSTEKVADILVDLEADRALARRLGKKAQSRVSKLCDGKSRADDLLSLWRTAVRNRAIL